MSLEVISRPLHVGAMRVGGSSDAVCCQWSFLCFLYFFFSPPLKTIAWSSLLLGFQL